MCGRTARTVRRAETAKAVSDPYLNREVLQLTEASPGLIFNEALMCRPVQAAVNDSLEITKSEN